MLKKTVIWILADITAVGLSVFFGYYYLIHNNIVNNNSAFTPENILQGTAWLWCILFCLLAFSWGIHLMDAEGIAKLFFLWVLASIVLAAEIALFLNTNENIGAQTILIMVNFVLLVLAVPTLVLHSGKE
jgi:hypothetical protein